MRIVVALGGNALLRRGETPSTSAQRANVRIAARALAPIADEHELVITHGNGPQVGLLALQAAERPLLADGSAPEAIPLDVLGAQTDGALGYMIEQELGNTLPFERPITTILTMIEVDADDPAFATPTKPIGPIYTEAEAHRLAEERGWVVAPDGPHWRRVVPSPDPLRIFQIRPILWLLEKGSVVICAGGGGIPTMFLPDGTLTGADAVIDKDRASALLARQLEADLLVLATDVDGVYTGWGTDDAEKISEATVAELRKRTLASGSMGPKVEAACDFVETTGGLAVIGALHQLEALVTGAAGTRVVP